MKLEDNAVSMLKDWYLMQEKSFDFWKDSLSRYHQGNLKDIVKSQSNKEIWKNWWEIQEKLFSMWKKKDGFLQQYSKFMNPLIFRGNTMPGITGTLGVEWIKTYLDDKQDNLLMSLPEANDEIYNRIMNSKDVYGKFLSFWDDLFINLPGRDNTIKWKEFSRISMQNYNKLMDCFFSITFPEFVKEMMKAPLMLAEVYEQTFSKLLQPWHDLSDEMKEKFALAMQGDRGAYKEFLKLWYKACHESYGKAFSVSPFGMNRERLEKMLSSIDTYIQFMVVVNDYVSLLYKVSYEVTANVMKKISEMADDGRAPVTFKEFYIMWWKANENAYGALFRSEEFNAAMQEVVTMWLEFKHRYDYLLEDLVGEIPDISDTIPLNLRASASL